MPGLRLEELCRGLPCRLEGDGSTRVEDLVLDSRAAGPGALFVALAGSRRDGAVFAAEAVGRGAVAVLLAEGAARPPGLPPAVPLVRAPRPRALLPELAARLWDHPAAGFTLAGVTGTNGKTTTASHIAHLLEAGLPGRPVAYWTTAEVFDGGRRFRPAWTTPEAPDLARFLDSARRHGARHAVIEVSSHALALDRVAGLTFRVGVVTNLSPDHLDFHGDLAGYTAAKRRLVAALTPPALALLNADDPVVAGFAAVSRVPVLFFGAGAKADLRLEDAVWDGGWRFRIRLSPRARSRWGLKTVIEERLALPGRHNLYNAVAALGAALELGANPGRVLAALPGLEAPVRRLAEQRVGPYRILDDVAMNSASYDAVLETLAGQGIRGTRLVVVNALRGNRGPAVNAAIARRLAAWNRRLDFAPLLVSLSRQAVAALSADYRVRPEEQAAFEAAAREAGLPIVVYPELEEALQAAVARLTPGATLLLLGTFGMDPGPDLARALLEARLAQTPGGPANGAAGNRNG
ncbi:UDP-N-acetylmuramoylalanyl-D-glutamate--2, 6-diaminopimelate ligase [Candidatus Hydrogenisulfobacillus filiaventi]|uniref:UDP-N-acetylmuramoylalanyl-D-glutamate--2, 6-diaminopimelate ligase n=1 Tax=Candidatus Hydrogenisulfobacillus filiaventi TaxID=2707344 RepID=A0A6F8ZE71_9FIRM|nr:Mur ligase family protein [Bacillota bacterium]CAB1128168.1 UDP-N-acetylmuramoylalanyl-D-glutamate--2, 6-diaminopimelate ligase [Candidatus Hydrogenisulfobacillus filiaventi]